MKKLLISILLILSSIRLVPHIIVVMIGVNRGVINADIEKWSNHALGFLPRTTNERLFAFIRLMTFYPEFRNLYYNRLVDMEGFYIGFVGRCLLYISKPATLELVYLFNMVFALSFLLRV